MALITYTNKVDTQTKNVPEVNKITASDMNEIKASVNLNVNDITLKSYLQFNATERTVWNNGKGDVSTNTSFGDNALASNTTGSQNTANGRSALSSNTEGGGNTATGRDSLFTNTLGGSNTANGAFSSYSNTEGDDNVAMGRSALYSTTEGDGNTALGRSALFVNTTGSKNTAIGNSSDVSTTNLTNATAIGSNAVVNASNKVRLGDTNVSVIEGQVAFSAASDERLKKNIEPLDQGIDFIMKLKPVKYNMINPNDTRLNYGFIAQEIEELVTEDNAILTVGGDEERMLGLRYTDFISPLVKAMQEQQDIIKNLLLEVENLKTKIYVRTRITDK